MNNFFKKISFGLHLDPMVEKINGHRRYIPEGKKAVLIIYADFELGWAWRYSKINGDPGRLAEIKGLNERKNVPYILDACDNYSIPVTWATVGHLFLDKCIKGGVSAHPEIKRYGYFENLFWKYESGDWFDADPCTDVKTNPAWYCPDLIKQIRAVRTEHEIGCHTFSHIDCSDENCPPDVFDSEIKECIRLASAEGIELKSFVHPAHTIGNLDGLIKNGFNSYRTDYNNILGYPEKYNGKLWHFKSTWEFVLFKEWSIRYHINRYIEILRRALMNETVCVFWFHPSMDIRFFEEVFPSVCEYINRNREIIEVTTASGYADFLEKNGL
ncbi:MAG: polysaccharide deacetylase family protein [Bacteroidetes bacterium]|nr:polysaccharide deacetylase family protein [Bacteroidota bacterium]